MLVLKLFCLPYLQLHLRRISIKCFQAKLALYLHHWYLSMPCVFRIYRHICPQTRNKALRLHSWNEMLTYWMSRHVAHSYGMHLGQDCNVIQYWRHFGWIKFVLARNPLLTYLKTKSALKDDKDIPFQDKNNILIPGSKTSFSKGVRIRFFFLYLSWSLSILSFCCQQLCWRQNANFYGLIRSSIWTSLWNSSIKPNKEVPLLDK